jgi:hypothetical protein
MVLTKGLPEPVSTSPMASTARRSAVTAPAKSPPAGRPSSTHAATPAGPAERELALHPLDQHRPPYGSGQHPPTRPTPR